jgi:hypothetical protein
LDASARKVYGTERGVAGALVIGSRAPYLYRADQASRLWNLLRALLENSGMSQLVADAVLVIHFCFVAFVLGGLALTWIGAMLCWKWVRNFWFRIAHVAAICFVAAEALLGLICPLTLWEDALRGTTSDSGFIERWLHSVMFYHLPEWVFTLAYVAFALVVVLTYWLVPPVRNLNRNSAP